MSDDWHFRFAVENDRLKAALEEARAGQTKKYFFAASSEFPVSVVVDPADIGKTVTLSELGCLVDGDEDREVTLSRYDARVIYVPGDGEAAS